MINPITETKAAPKDGIKPIMEVNGNHPIAAALKDMEDEARVADAAAVY